jgi:TetR/AcrR family transcriptional regulator
MTKRPQPRTAPAKPRPATRRAKSGRAAAPRRATTRRGGPRPGADSSATRTAILAAAADQFSRRGFDGVVVDDIAGAAAVNKAMIYYHFADKIALYREVVCEMLRDAGARVSEIAARAETPADKLTAFIAAFVGLSEARPYFPPLMMREIAEGAPHLDDETLSLMRGVFLAFSQILGEGARTHQFRPINPVLAYMTVLGPVMLNAARERAGAGPGRGDLPMFVHVSHADLTRHMQTVALRMLQKD